MANSDLIQKRYRNSEFYKYLLESESARGAINAKRTLQDERERWGGVIDAVPPGSFLELFLRQVYETSEIKLEIPFSAAIAYVSAYLLNKGVKVNVEGELIGADLWLLLLAPSGSGKTFAIKLLQHYLGKDSVPMMPECQSDAAFIEALRDNNNSLWCRDEFGQLMKGLEKPGPMEKLRDYLLRTFDNSDIEYRTKKENYTIESAALTIYGGTVFDTWSKCVSEESMLDGFAQRFAYVVADSEDESEERRKFENNAFWKSREEERDKTVKDAWEKLVSHPLHSVYRVSEDALKEYEEAFKSLWRVSDGKIAKSFFRRILFRSFKYSIIYHFILGKESDIIDAQDMAWAIRAAKLHIRWLFDVMELFEVSEVEKKIRLVEGAIERLESRGQTVDARKLLTYVRSIQSITEAQALLKLVKGG